MMQSDTGMVNTIIAPVIGHALSQGEDIRYDPDFERVETEISRLTSVHKNHRTDWKLVQQLSYQLLTTRTKDLRLACWFAGALLKNNGLSQLPQVFAIVHGFISHYGASCFPVKARARLAVLNWLFERIDFNDAGFAETLSSETLSILVTALETCDTTLNTQFGDDAPFLQPKLQQLRDIQRRQQMDKPAEPISPELPSAVSPLSPAVSAPNVSAISEDGDSVRIARYLQEQSRLLIPYFLHKDLADPRAYLLTRSCAWLQISAVPAADRQGVTQLKPLTANKLQEYQQRMAAKEFATLIPDVEMSLSKAPFWFDGHYWCAQALLALGYAEMAHHLRDYLRSFLTKFPALTELCFDDGSPFMQTETKAWLLAAPAEQHERVTVLNDSNSTEQPWSVALKTATDNVRQDSSLLKQEMRGLQLLANLSGSGRDKTCWQLALVKFCQQHQRHDLAVLILEEIYQVAERFQLNQWEPLLAKEILQLWQHSLEKINSKQHQEKISEIKTNLYRMDISMAF